MKISIAINTENGYKKFEVEGYPAFEMYGHKFLAHRGIDVKNGRAHYRRNDWRVSEPETGSAIVVQRYTFTDAFIESRELLVRKGIKEFRKAFKLAKATSEGRTE